MPTNTMTPQKIDPNRTHVDHDGYRFRHLVVDLTEAQSIASVRESPDVWSRVQERRDKRLKRGDLVTLVSHDGLTIGEGFRVTRALAGSVWLSKPSRMIELETEIMFSDGVHAVEPVGTGFAIKTLRDGHVEARVFPTAKAAETEIIRRTPSKVA